ncbi:MAG: hypothetical protein PUB00_07485 [Clostridiales bacterium]|nr:hypothetical protein [Clostridiales bacterium]
MSWFPFSHKSKSIEYDPEKAEKCLANIKRKISEITGVSKFIELDDNFIAFSGTPDNPDLLLYLDITSAHGKKYLYASMDDRLSWQEWEFNNQDDFENSIVEFICGKINRTIKTITEQKKHKYIRITEYQLDKNTNEWILMSDQKVSWLIIRPFITEDSLEEEIKEYHL